MVIEGVIKTEQEYNLALDRTLELFDSQPSDLEFNEFQVLLILIKDYEDRNFKIPYPDPIDAIKYKLQELGLKNKDLIPLMGSESHVSAILSGRRRLTLEMARDLNQILGIPADVLLAPSTKLTSAKLEDNDMNEIIDDQLKKSRERITRLKALSAKLKSELIFSNDEFSEVIAGNVKVRGPKKVIN